MGWGILGLGGGMGYFGSLWDVSHLSGMWIWGCLCDNDLSTHCPAVALDGGDG